MSDCFDHEMDAWESQAQASMYGDSTESYSSNRSYSRNPRYYHKLFLGISIEAKTDKAYLIKFASEEKAWVAKSLCKELTESSVYIWEGATITPIKELIEESYTTYEKKIRKV